MFDPHSDFQHKVIHYDPHFDLGNYHTLLSPLWALILKPNRLSTHFDYHCDSPQQVIQLDDTRLKEVNRIAPHLDQPN